MGNIYCFTGAQSTGKSTLINELRRRGCFSEAEFKQSITRSLQKQGFKINEEGDDATQIAIMKGHEVILRECQASNMDTILDRCAIDGFAYTKYLYNHHKVSLETLKFAEKILKECLKQYNMIFYLRPEFEIEDDGTRSTSVSFRDEVAEEFESVINEIQTGHVLGEKINISLTILSGSLEERIAIVKTYTL